MIRLLASATGLLALVLLVGQAVPQDTPKPGTPVQPPADTTKPDTTKPDATKVKTPALPPGWKKLNLTADQKTTIHKVQSDYKVKIKALEDQLKTLHDEETAAMVKVLTEPQREQLRKALVPDDPKATPDTKTPDTKAPDSK